MAHFKKNKEGGHGWSKLKQQLFTATFYICGQSYKALYDPNLRL